MKKLLPAIFMFAIAACSAGAPNNQTGQTSQIQRSYPSDIEDRRSLDPAQTRDTVQGELIDNPKGIKCRSVMDCRMEGQDLDKVSGFHPGPDFPDTDYPGECRELNTATGKYVYKASACARNDGSH